MARHKKSVTINQVADDALMRVVVGDIREELPEVDVTVSVEPQPIKSATKPKNLAGAENAARNRVNCEIVGYDGEVVTFKSHGSTATINIEGMEYTQIMDALSKVGF